MKKYSTYKDSGIEWIGDIPSHWDLVRLNVLGIFSKGKGITRDNIRPKGNPCIRNGEIYTTYDRITNNIISFINNDIAKQSVTVSRGALLFTGDGETIEEIGKCLVYDGDEPVYVGGGINVFTPKLDKVNHIYMSYVMNSKNVIYQKARDGKGEIVVHIYAKQLKEIRFGLPSLKEQHQIVAFLDDKTAKTNNLIGHKEKKIELLKEKRTALINHVVNKGLNPDVELKDSEVEWIGEVPRHWKISKLGFYTTKIGAGSTPRGGSEVYVDEGIPFVRSQNVHFDGLRLNNVSFIEHEVHSKMKGTTVVKNDILLNITGGSIGRCCVVDIEGEMNVNQHVSIIRTTEKLINYFLNYIIASDIGQSQVKFNLTGGNREGLTIEGIRDFRITIPNKSEQRQIVNYLDEQTKELDDLIQLEQQKIVLLKEYRQSLISEVVTGKLRVCEEDLSTKQINQA